MQDFRLFESTQSGTKLEGSETLDEKNEQSMRVAVSAICEKNGEKLAYVTFTSGNCEAEGVIPECKITKNKGFSDEEKAGLELYMKSDLKRLKKMAAGVNVLDAFMGDKK